MKVMDTNAEVRTLNRADAPAYAHKLVDNLIEDCDENYPISMFVISYQPQRGPVISYCGRSLNHTELIGVLAQLTHVYSR